MDRLEVLGRHDVLAVDRELVACGIISDEVAPAADLIALAPIGRLIHLPETEVALATHRHAERPVGKHLDADRLPLGTTNILLLYRTVDQLHLVQRELAGKHHHVSVAGVEAERLDIGDIELSAEVDLHPLLVGVGHGGDVGGDDGRDAGGLCGVDDLVHPHHILGVDDGIDGEVALHPVVTEQGCHLGQVLEREALGGVGPHIEPLDAEVGGIGTTLDRCHERLPAAGRCHDLEVFSFH